jgi:hypothetical protein
VLGFFDTFYTFSHLFRQRRSGEARRILARHVYNMMIYGWFAGRGTSDGAPGGGIGRRHQVEMGCFNTFYTFSNLFVSVEGRN